MNRIPGRLGTLVARDVMSTEVLVLPEEKTLVDAVELLKEHKHSGAPVVNSRGHLVGTFSLRNLTGVKRNKTAKEDQKEVSGVESGIISAAALEKLMKTAAAQERVVDRMTENAPSVSENATLIDVARLMCDFHTHRIPVINSRSVLTGIITTMDVLAALVHTADELTEKG